LSNDNQKKIEMKGHDPGGGGRIPYPALLALFVLILALFNHYWAARQDAPPFQGGLICLKKSLEYHKSLASGDIFSFLASQGDFYPPLPFQAAAIFFFLFKPGYAWAVTSMAPFLAILVFSTYLLGKHLWGEKAGLAAAIMAASIPGTAFFGRVPNADIPAAAFLPLLVYALLRSEGLTVAKYSLLTALAMALGMLSKLSFPLYAALPLAWIAGGAILQNLKDEKTRKETLLTLAALLAFWAAAGGAILLFHGNSSLAASPDASERLYLGFLAVCGLLIYGALRGIRGLTPFSRHMAGLGLIVPALTGHYFLFHAHRLPGIYRTWFWTVQYRLLLPTRTAYHFFVDFFIFKYIGLFFLALVLAGIALCLRNKDRKPGVAMAAAAIGSAIFLLYLQPVYEPYYFIPLSGLFALFAVSWIFSLKGAVPRAALTFAWGAVAFVYLFGWAFLPPSMASLFSANGILTPAHAGTLNGVTPAAGALARIPSPAPPPQGTLYVFADETRREDLPPLLWLLEMSMQKPAGSEASLLFTGADPIFPSKEEPWGVYLYPARGERDGEEPKDRSSWQERPGEGTSPGTDTDVKNRLDGAPINEVLTDSVVICRLVQREGSAPPSRGGPPVGYEYYSRWYNLQGYVPPGLDRKSSPPAAPFPGGVISRLDIRMQGALKGLRLLQKMDVTGDTVMEVYGVEFREGFAESLNRSAMPPSPQGKD
jgi:4-amino-4-deoxy-L-arabinose transferase-like glycosyltransferase